MFGDESTTADFPTKRWSGERKNSNDIGTIQITQGSKISVRSKNSVGRTPYPS